MEFKSFASSSAGNAYTVTDGGTVLLLECGLRFKELEKRLGHRLHSVSACLITHEHADHSRANRELSESGIPVYSSTGTAAALGNPLINRVGDREAFTIGTVRVLPFRVFHDAAEPFGYLLRGQDGTKLLFATDTKCVPCAVDGLDILAVECNHDKLLCDSSKPWIKRAANTHMSIDKLCEYLDKLDKSRLKQIYLLHLSDRHSDEDGFVRRIMDRYHIKTVACKK